jgi:hypothetical protein
VFESPRILLEWWWLLGATLEGVPLEPLITGDRLDPVVMRIEAEDNGDIRQIADARVCRLAALNPQIGAEWDASEAGHVLLREPLFQADVSDRAPENARGRALGLVTGGG